MRVLVVAFSLMVGLSGSGHAAPFSHAEFDRILRSHVRDGHVDYEGIRKTDAAALGAYVASLATADPSAMPREAQLAFWLNAYNALVIHAVVQGHTPETTLGRAAFFFGRTFRVAGRGRTLDDIEAKGIRLMFKDPRVHFALVCASSGCPRLKSGAYDGGSLEQTLDESARLFINDPSKVRLDHARRVLHLSSIFKWYRKDFAAAEPREADASLVAYVAQWLGPEDAASLRGGGWKIQFESYDWRLNGSRPQSPPSDSSTPQRMDPGF